MLDPQLKHAARICHKDKEIEDIREDLRFFRRDLRRVEKSLSRICPDRFESYAQRQDEYFFWTNFLELEYDVRRLREAIREGSRRMEAVYAALEPRPLITTVYMPPPHNAPHQACSICYETLEVLMQVKQCPRCPQLYHDNCMNTWLQMQETEQHSLICPSCRQIVARE